MKVLSWNVLLRKHEMKYNPTSEILKEFPIESKRVKQIVQFLLSQKDTTDVFCLQECSKELLSALQLSFADLNVTYVNHKTDEYLVTISPKDFHFHKESKWENKCSHGFFSVCNDTYRIINCHLIPRKYCKENVSDYMNNLPKDKITIIVGDFNNDFRYVRENIGERYLVPRFNKTYKNRCQLDYIVLDMWPKWYRKKIFCQNPVLSDHNAIRLSF